MESASNNTSVKYHDIFDYKLTKEEAIRWQYKKQKVAVISKRSRRQLQREKYSQKKLVIAKEAAKLISKIPSVLFVGITGSLAMMNAGKNSDIDLMIVTKKNTLWTTRLLVYCILHTTGYMLRRPKIEDEKDALCLNMWLDETGLVWQKKERNIYTAHEIAQIIPLANKENVYERFLYLNKWILEFWPNSVKIQKNNIEKTVSLRVRNNLKFSKFKYLNFVSDFVFRASNFIAFTVQYLYMKSKITNEVITPTRALFHPNNNSKYVLDKLKMIE